MRQKAILDTGPLVALLDRRDDLHSWATQTFRAIQYPLLTCEPVITEACFLLSSTYGAQEAVMSLIKRGAIEINFSLSNHADELSKLIVQYSSVPMSLADACLVKMAELHKNRVLVTFDSDFQIYRMNRTQLISLIMPENQRDY